ncbi:MAG: hypothetical protein KA084_02350 [Brachymonas sp.]|nr:hypothetical protein [Brachymonas sp.]MBP6967031.1 hypothetical protein [Brachymonas sp.]MBP7246784.1 hypothetical protein [Brachymonas sp.]MBP7734213.1 hypothetical protein [Brachymonas sp.]MBP7743842.1 hypothetical protein [Brachymonas sp.]
MLFQAASVKIAGAHLRRPTLPQGLRYGGIYAQYGQQHFSLTYTHNTSQHATVQHWRFALKKHRQPSP